MSNWSVIALRLVMAFIYALIVGLFIYVFLAAMAGDATDLFDTFDIPSPFPKAEEVETWRYAVGLALSSVVLLGVGLKFLAIHRLLGLAQRREMASTKTATELRRVGLGMIVLWIGIIILDGIVPYTLLSGVSDTVDFEIGIVSLETIIAIGGIALRVVAGVADEASALKEEMAGVV